MIQLNCSWGDFVNETVTCHKNVDWEHSSIFTKQKDLNNCLSGKEIQGFFPVVYFFVLLCQVTWKRSQPMGEDVALIIPSPIARDHSHVTWDYRWGMSPNPVVSSQYIYIYVYIYIYIMCLLSKSLTNYDLNGRYLVGYNFENILLIWKCTECD